VAFSKTITEIDLVKQHELATSVDVAVIIGVAAVAARKSRQNPV